MSFARGLIPADSLDTLLVDHVVLLQLFSRVDGGRHFQDTGGEFGVLERELASLDIRHVL